MRGDRGVGMRCLKGMDITSPVVSHCLCNCITGCWRDISPRMQ
jgi:hypothetical protein